MEDDMPSPAPKRVGPPEVPPVRVGNLSIEAIHWGKERGLGQNGGYIAARDAKTNEEQWILKIYNIDYDELLEEDVQDVFIESMKKNQKGDALDITDERGRRYLVDVAGQSVTAQ
jgi:hypothetical protein